MCLELGIWPSGRDLPSLFPSQLCPRLPCTFGLFQSQAGQGLDSRGRMFKSCSDRTRWLGVLCGLWALSLSRKVEGTQETRGPSVA